jgi:putative effector of murein hydrolase LrgA (UPF0299 family)
MGAMLGMLYAIIVMRGALKEISPKTATLMSMFVFLGIIWFLDSIVEDLFWVVLSVILGYIMYIIVSSIGQQNINEYKSYKDEKTRIKARKEAQEDIVGV